ncbi:transcription elongation factor Spt5 [Candidatus Pacearchaeota archaeon CG10_big_fil_rev_8_21_14_0_10_35_219]|nr:transcription elongation factor Spt5 [Candidatus Pacearchaeota archaeon]OIO42343.1 MAG: transcription elongation factor Spt5 [Candidatus Pacearchaeota archaeon CG1_02_35_32]PIO07422.1 MAG: transcription elongation factor Spt5 [Candidatus Pacearchaeota archaeon CG10_big_fil_rev_8_21_14_0_10_35_219]PIY81228.1 MAG: transcription elongation factor Spt5 [Candidatus Pacearchaeota archaeon CG_4_10_14_0_8_um_filter_35_169]PIZ80158.1 MAG: transcription elongation factor Spt5 [Candidatus Pacearchaeota
MIFIVKVTTNKEERALEMIADRVKKKGIQVYSAVKPHGLRGYIIIEAEDRDSVEEAAYNIREVKGILSKNISYEEIKNMLQPEVEDFNIEAGDIVEMIADTFKNEKGKVTRIDKKKGEVVVSLLGAAVPIPVTVKMDNIRVIRREKDEEEEDAEN